MIAQRYEEVRAHQATLLREAAQDRMAREVFERSPPRLSALVTTMRSALARRFPRVPRTGRQPIGPEAVA